MLLYSFTESWAIFCFGTKKWYGMNLRKIFKKKNKCKKWFVGIFYALKIFFSIIFLLYTISLYI